MTDGKPEVGRTEHVSQAQRGKIALGGLGLGLAARDAGAAPPEPSARATQLARRARNCADIAHRILVPAEPAEEASIRAVVSELYRQSAYWALCALAADSGGAAGTGYDDSIWDTLDERLLAEVAQGSERAEWLRALLRTGSFVHFAELPPAASALASSGLRQLARLLRSKLNERSRAVRLKHAKRGIALGALALLALLGIAGVLRWRDAHELLAGKPWRASSLNGAGCVSPAQSCAQSPSFFFHTNDEKDPWLEFDLGATHSVSRAAIENRQDCCSDRAVPLELQVSTDHENWKIVAREAEDFTSWNVSFDSVEARWVRLQTRAHNYLHLAGARVW